MLTLHLGAVDSRYATDAEIRAADVNPADLPPGFRLMAHQAHTLAALRDETTSIVINKARTGDGKSFIAQYLTFMRLRRGLTMYPTNELAADQERSLRALQASWPDDRAEFMHWSLLNGPRLDALERELTDHTRSGLIDDLLAHAQLTLTNPDIFHLLMQFRYFIKGSGEDTLFGRIANGYDLFTFDEFHIFNSPQVSAVLIALLLLDEAKGRRPDRAKFLFLSATTNKLLTKLAHEAGMTCTEIEGAYADGHTVPPPDHRRILQPVTLHLHERGDGLEAWVTAHVDQIVDFYRQHPDTRGLILCNSVATAYRIYLLLKPICQQAGITLAEPNTGLTPVARRHTDADLIIATSTVDVGVDFKINLLIFESLDYPTHIQRLGRLGRHTANAAGQPFSAYVAHALLPGWVVDKLTTDFPAPEAVNSRSDYQAALHNAYPSLQEFDGYRNRYGGLQAGSVLAALKGRELRTQYRVTHDALNKRYEGLFPPRLLWPNTLARWKTFTAIYAEITSFRGGSPFVALVENALSGNESLMTYDLLTLLRSGRLYSIPLDAAYQRAGEAAATLKARQPLAAFRLEGWLAQPRRVSIVLNEDAQSWDETDFETVVESRNFRLRVEGEQLPDLLALNDTLEDRVLVALLIRRWDATALRLRYQLGMQLDLLPFTTADSVTGTAAFGRDALLLDSLFYKNKPRPTAPLFG